MPYIKVSERLRFDHGLDAIQDTVTKDGISEGDLNYLITNLVSIHISHHGKSYSVLNGVVGVLECAKAELYRRVIAPYENKKIVENGDVY
jgi:hypothetical protein